MNATAKVFEHGRSQVVQLPKEFRFEGSEVRVTKVESTRSPPAQGDRRQQPPPNLSPLCAGIHYAQVSAHERRARGGEEHEG